MTIDRRSLLKSAGVIPLMGAAPHLVWAAADQADEKVDYTLRIGTGLIELAPEHIVRRRSITASFPDRCCASRKGSASLSMFTTIPIRRKSFTGTD